MDYFINIEPIVLENFKNLTLWNGLLWIFVFSKSEPPWNAYTLGSPLGYVAIMYLDYSVV
jgi:hypothetical protein